jgi:hypothetical protein
MDLIPELINLVAQYLAPSEQVSLFDLMDQKIKEDKKYWVFQAKKVFGISYAEFKKRKILPYERYLQYYTEAGGVDYGSERYHDNLDDLIKRSIDLDDSELVSYFGEMHRRGDPLDETIIALADREDYQKFRHLVPFTDEQVAAIEVRRDIIVDDIEHLSAIGERYPENLFIIKHAYNEAISSGRYDMIRPIYLNLGPPLKHHLGMAVESSDDILELLITLLIDDRVISVTRLLELRDFAERRGEREKAAFLQQRAQELNEEGEEEEGDEEEERKGD